MAVGEERAGVEAATGAVESARWLSSSAALFDSSLTPEELLSLIAAKAREAIPARAAATVLFRENEAVTVGVSPSDEGDAWRSPETAELARRGRSAVLLDAGDGAPAGYLAAPILDGEGECIGVVELAGRAGGDFDARDAATAGQLTHLAAAAIANANAYRELRRHADELDAVFALTALVSAASSAEEVFAAALDALESALAITRGSVVLFDARGAIHFSAWRGLSDSYRRRIEGSAPWKGHAGDPAPLLVDDVFLDPEVAELHDAFREEGIRSMLLVPLVHGEAILGRFVLYADRPAAFSPDDVRLAVAMASHVAATVEARRADDEIRRSRHQLEAIVQTSSDGITVQEPGGRLVFANDAAAQLTGFDTAEELLATPPEQILARFELLDEDGVTPLRLTELPGRRAAVEAREFERVICYRIAATGERRWSLVRATPVLRPDGTVEIVVNVFHEVTESRVSEERLRFLGETSRALAASLDVESTLGEVARLAVPVLADYCLIDVLDGEGQLGRVIIRHADEGGQRILEELRERFPPTFNERHPATRAVSTADPVLFPTVTTDVLVDAALEPEHLELYQQLEPRSYLVVPLVARGRVLGSISLGTSSLSGRHYDAADVVLARELADRAAVALDNALLFDASREALAQLETVLVSAPVGIGFWDTDLRFVRVNDALAEINGLPPAAHVGRTLGDVLPGLAEHLEPLYRRVLETGEPLVHQESTAADPGVPGAERHWLTSYFPVRPSDGETIGIGAVILEITERERAQRRFRFLARASEILASSLVVDEVVPRITQLAIESFCDACAVWALEGDELVQLARSTTDAASPPYRLHERYHLERDAHMPVVQVALTGDGIHRPVVTDDELRALGRDSAEAAAFVEHATRSWMVQPLVVRGHLRGAITFASRAPGRHDEEDFAAAAELARRVAVELDQADLHREATESLALLDALFSTAPAGLAFFDAELRFVRVNDALAELDGLPAGDHVGRAVADVVPGMDAAVEGSLREALTTGRAVRREVAGATQAANGVRHWLVDSYPVVAAGRTLGIGTVVVDITDRKRAEARLRESEERFRTLADTVPALVWMCDHENRCTYFNRGWLEFTGRPLDQSLGGAWLDVVHPADRERIRREDEAAFTAREPFTLEYRLRRHDGVFRWVMDEGVPRYEADGSYAGYIGAAIDIDDRRRAEDRERFLADASTLLAASLEVDTTLASIATLAVPRIADWCSVALREDDGSIRTVAVAHKDPAKVAWARELQERVPTDPDAPAGAPAVIRTGRPELMEDIPDELIVEALADRPELIEPLRELGLRSSLVVPLVARDRVIGALSLVTAAESGRVLGAKDLALAGEVARRAAVAVENARLFAHTELQRSLLESQGEASLDGLLVVSPDGRFLSSNRRFAELWGIPDDVIEAGDDAAALEVVATKVADPEGFLARVRELYDRRESAREQITLLDGRTLERYGAPVRGPDGADHGYLWSFRDVSAQVRAGERVAFLGGASELLAESLDLQETLTRLAALAIPALADFCVFDVLEGGEVRQAAAVHRSRPSFGAEMARHVAPLEHAGHPASAAMRTGRTQLVERIDDAWLEGMSIDRGHAELVRSLRPTSVLAVPLLLGRVPIGAVTFGFAESGRTHTAADVSLAEELARRAAMAVENARLYAEAEARAQASQALEFVGDGVFLVDSDGIVRLWNPAAERITGLAADAVVGTRAAETLAPWPLEHAGEREHTYPVDAGERELWLALTAVPFEHGTVYAFRDLTDERALEQLKSDFVSTVSHELRTPLAAIYGAAMTLQRTDVALADEQRVGLLSVVASEAERLARIVNDVLWASRLDAGVLEVSIETCDGGALASAVVAAARAHLPPAIELLLEVAPGTPPVAADPDKVRQVLVNLVDNAIKYSPDGGVVDVRVEPSGASVRFTVSDRGLGIPAGEHGRIFEKFFRLDPNLTRGVGGTGLGLYICRELVRRMDGRIWVESEEGAGSLFAFELPVAV